MNNVNNFEHLRKQHISIPLQRSQRQTNLKKLTKFYFDCPFLQHFFHGSRLPEIRLEYNFAVLDMEFFIAHIYFFIKVFVTQLIFIVAFTEQIGNYFYHKCAVKS